MIFSLSLPEAASPSTSIRFSMLAVTTLSTVFSATLSSNVLPRGLGAGEVPPRPGGGLP